MIKFFRSASDEAQGKYLIVGLGNPGREHRGNRHNIGFMAIDQLAARWEIRLSRVQHKAVVGNGLIGQQPVILAKPQTYMNRSGQAVSALARFYKTPPNRILVVYDEIDLPFGTLRLREKGGSGGHNGMKSIISYLGEDFPRVRLGIGRPPERMDPAAYVLQDFAGAELPILNELIGEALLAVETFLTDGIELAMSRHNGAVTEA